MGSWQAVGQHEFLVDDDTVHWNVCGDISGREIVAIFEEGVRVQSVHGYALFCLSVRGDWGFPSETRQAVAQFHRKHKAVGAMAIVGLSAKARMFMDLVLRGVAKVSGRPPNTRFFGSQQDAGVWLGEVRVQFRENLLAQKK
jgi:hypothetical protein